ncbi:MAG: HAD family hydrolase [Candidatus Micrarchaeota archaeon]
MIKAILFDMDGVLFDSRGDAIARFRTVLDDFGFKFPEELEGVVLKGGTDPQIIKELLPELDEPTVIGMAKQAAELTAPLKNLKINPGVKEAIIKLSKTHKLAIVSNDNRLNVERKLRKFDLIGYFPVIFTADDGVNPKPRPEPILKCLKLLGVGKEEAIYIGDNEVDRLAGEAAGVKTIVRSNLHEDKHFFKKEIFELLK